MTSIKYILETPTTYTKYIYNGNMIDLAYNLSTDYNVILHNFGNNEIPGGPSGCKGNTQEEQIFRRTNIRDILNKDQYPIDSIEDHYRYWKYNSIGTIFSSNVKIYPNDKIENDNTIDRKISILTNAAICNPFTTEDKYKNQFDRNIMIKKISQMSNVLNLENPTNEKTKEKTKEKTNEKTNEKKSIFITGEWGMGAFGNPPELLLLMKEIQFNTIYCVRRENFKLLDYPIYE